MKKFKLIDLNRSLIQQAKKASIDAVWGDYFSEAEKIPNAVLITASNPKWTFGGGIDLGFYNHFYSECREKQEKGGGMERIGNIVFAITVNEEYKSTPEIVKQALEFGLSTLKKNETLVTSALGTGIGGLPTDIFIEIIKDLSPESWENKRLRSLEWFEQLV